MKKRRGLSVQVEHEQIGVLVRKRWKANLGQKMSSKEWREFAELADRSTLPGRLDVYERAAKKQSDRPEAPALLDAIKLLREALDRKDYYHAAWYGMEVQTLYIGLCTRPMVKPLKAGYGTQKGGRKSGPRRRISDAQLAECQRDMDQLARSHPRWSKTQLRDKVARRRKISRRSLERYKITPRK